jgi:hypothetical protein
MRQGTPNPMLDALRVQVGSRPADEVWFNDLYQVTVTYMGGPDEGREGFMHLSMKRHDRHPMTDWRHYQAIKNEIAGPEREAVEIYPAESRLVDTSNEYHLWVFPEDYYIEFGFTEQLLSSDTQVRMFNDGRKRGEHKGRQRPFQPGLPVAEGRNDKPDAEEDMSAGLLTPTQAGGLSSTPVDAAPDSWGDALARAADMQPGDTIHLPDGASIRLEEVDDD